MIQQLHFWVCTLKELKARFQRDIYTAMFIGALFTVVRRILRNEWENKIWSIQAF